MSEKIHVIDPFLFDKQFRLFTRFLDLNGSPLQTFGSNVYIDAEEGYKYKVHSDARDILNSAKWQPMDIGTGRIAQHVIQATELKINNLVTTDNRYGESGKALFKLHQTINDKDRAKLHEFERAFYDLFCGSANQETFKRFVGLFGPRYPIIAYLFFLKDRSLYMPIAPETFDAAFKKLGVAFSTSGKCSWYNYTIYVDLLKNIQWHLMENIPGDISLLDAHSFSYILAKQMSQEFDEDAEDIQNQIKEYNELSQKDRDAITKARIGQGPFRQSVLSYWKICAVTGCSLQAVLKASHIKPWRDCSVPEALDPYNALLLSPNLDTLFDTGFISFTDSGEIIISDKLSRDDAQLLGVNGEMNLRQRLDSKHLGYLQYHRDNLFKAE